MEYLLGMLHRGTAGKSMSCAFSHIQSRGQVIIKQDRISDQRTTYGESYACGMIGCFTCYFEKFMYRTC